MCFGEREIGVFLEGAINYMCGIAIGLDDSSQVLMFLGQYGGVTNLLIYSFDDT